MTVDELGSDIECRLATLEDVEVVIEHRLAYLDVAYAEFPPQQRTALQPTLTDYFVRQLMSGVHVALSFAGDVCVSGAHLVVHSKPPNLRVPSGLIGEVVNVFTLPDHRRQGHAGACMRLLLEKAKDLRLSSVGLESSTAGVTLYEGLGFERASTGYVPMRFPIEVWL